MASKFQRSTSYEDSLYPQIYHTFKAKDLEGDELVEFYIQDMTEKHYDEAVEFIAKYLMPEEIFCRAAKIPGNEAAEKAFKVYYSTIVKEKFSLACFSLKTHEMVALNSFVVETRGLQNKIMVHMYSGRLNIKTLSFLWDAQITVKKASSGESLLKTKEFYAFFLPLSAQLYFMF